MGARWKAWACGVFLVVSPAQGDDMTEAPAECRHDPGSFACSVATETWRSLSAFVAALEEDEISPYQSLDPMFFYPRLVAAEGDLGEAIDLALKMDPDGAARGLPWYANTKSDLLDTLNAIAVDPVSPTDVGVLSTLALADLELAGPWAMVSVARVLASVGNEKQARTLFQAAADAAFSDPRVETGTASKISRDMQARLLAVWAASSFSVDALAYVADWAPLNRGYAALAIADGLAWTGDIEATRTLVESLEGALPMLGGLAIAEAERRSGDAEAALDRLHATQQDMTQMRQWLVKQYRLRFAQAYALLGDFDAMHDAAGWAGTNSFAYFNFWPKVAPFVACHDLPRAIALMANEAALMADDRAPYAWHLVDTLIAAAAAGHGEEAFAVARHTENDLHRTLLFMAVLTGLRQGQDIPAGAPACATLMLVAR
jgi:hypothetical protein